MNSSSSRKPSTNDSENNKKFHGFDEETVVLSGDTVPNPPVHASSASNEWVGRRLGKYQINGVLGTGGMGVVLKAHDASIERHVAIKVLSTELSSDEVALKRFLAEAKSAGKLNHPNVVTIYEIAQQDAIHYLVMECVDGGNTASHLKSKGAFPVSEATRIVTDACLGLAAAHQVGLVHRDIKPANLLLAKDGAVKISDFGLARQTDSQSARITRAGQVVGTPCYMSPEQCMSSDVDSRSDIYALGATYFSLLIGKSPFADLDSMHKVILAHSSARRPDPHAINPEIPKACSRIILRAMSVDPRKRYQTADEMRKDLDSVLSGDESGGTQKNRLWSGLTSLFRRE